MPLFSLLFKFLPQTRSLPSRSNSSRMPTHLTTAPSVAVSSSSGRHWTLFVKDRDTLRHFISPASDFCPNFETAPVRNAIARRVSAGGRTPRWQAHSRGEPGIFSDWETVFILAIDHKSQAFGFASARCDGVEFFLQANSTRGTTGIISGEKPLAWHRVWRFGCDISAQ